MMGLLEGEEITIHGIRLYQTHKPKIPDEFVNLYTVIKAEYDRWMDPATIGEYKVHGTQLMLRFGHDNHMRMGAHSSHCQDGGTGLFEQFDFTAAKLPINIMPGKKHGGYQMVDSTEDHQVHLIDCVRIPSSWKRIKETCSPDSALVQWGELLEKYLGPATVERERELALWLSVMDGFATACDWATPSDQHQELHELKDARLKEMKTHLAPVEAGWRKVWDHYSCLRLFEDIPVQGKEFEAMLDYIHVIDAR
jgi:hypothetical protein